MAMPRIQRLRQFVVIRTPGTRHQQHHRTHNRCLYTANDVAPSPHQSLPSLLSTSITCLEAQCAIVCEGSEDSSWTRTYVHSSTPSSKDALKCTRGPQRFPGVSAKDKGMAESHSDQSCTKYNDLLAFHFSVTTSQPLL